MQVSENVSVSKMEQTFMKTVHTRLNAPDGLYDFMLSNPIIDRCFGSFFGAMIGDALGSHCQFARFMSKERLECVMEMPGGGLYPTKPGQVTDDSQLAMQMLKGLLQYDSDQPLSQSLPKILVQIAGGYIGWLNSQPFDKGDTITSAIKILQTFKAHQSLENLDGALKEISETQTNIKSLSNGYLMKISPMIIFNVFLKLYEKQGSEKVQQLIQYQTKMTHPHPACEESAKEWISLLSSLIMRKQTEEIKKIYENFTNKKFQTEEVKDWKEEAKSQKLFKDKWHVGYAKIAFSNGLKQLKEISQTIKSEEQLDSALYINSIKEIINLCGDTDTNAAIVGGMLGSLIGFKKLPESYMKKLFTLSLKKGTEKVERPKFYEPSQAFKNLIKLLNKFQKNGY